MEKIKASDVRIGNYVTNLDNEIIEIKSNHINFLNKDYVSYYGIKITEYWIVNLGFDEDNDFQHPKAPIYFIKINDEWLCFIHNYGYKSIKYLHQLQNLFYILTNKEII